MLRKIISAALIALLPSFAAAQSTFPGTKRSEIMTNYPGPQSTVTGYAVNHIATVLGDGSCTSCTGLSDELLKAEQYLSSAPGIIYVLANGTMSYEVDIRDNHALVLVGNITWNAPIKIGVTGGAGAAVSCPGKQTINVAQWIILGATSNSFGGSTSSANFSLANCHTSASTSLHPVAVYVNGPSKAITVHDNRFENTQGIQTDSTSSTYSGANSGNSPTDINFSDNQIDDLAVVGQIPGAAFRYTSNIRIEGNLMKGVTDGITVFGGDGCISGCTAGGNGALGAVRGSAHVSIANNTIQSTNRCIFLSMVSDPSVEKNSCTGPTSSGTTGIEFDGTLGGFAKNNSVGGYPSADYAVRNWAGAARFSHNLARSTSEPPFASFADATVGGGLQYFLTDNDFRCNAACVVQMNGGAERILFDRNNLRNVYFSHPSTAQAVGRIDVRTNDFENTVVLPYNVKIQNVTCCIGAMVGTVNVTSNTFQADVAQTGATTIYVQLGDASNQTLTKITSNLWIRTSAGATPTEIECDGPITGSGSVNWCTVANNTMIAANIVHHASGSIPDQTTLSNNTAAPF